MKLPLRIIWVPWLFIIPLSMLPIFDYRIFTIDFFFFVISFLIFSSIGFVFGSKIKTQNRQLRKPSNKFIYLILFFSYLYILIELYLLTSKGFGKDFTFSLYGLTEMRYESRGEEVGENSSFLSVLSTIISGFPLISFMLLLYIDFNNFILSRKIRLSFILVIIISFLLYLSSGGRNSIVLLLLIFFFFLILYRKYASSKSHKEVFSKYKKRFIFLLGIVLVLIVGITLARTKYKDTSSSFNIKQYYMNGFGVMLNPSISNSIVGENSELITTSLSLYYYMTHSIHELNKTLESKPENFPYYGNYQFYQFSLLLNKMGLNLLSINEIKKELVNDGKYFGLIGAMYLDFGYGCLFVFFILGYFLGYFWTLFNRCRTFNSFVGLILIFILYLFSPFYSYLGIGVFSSLFSCLIFINILSKIFRF